MGLCAWRPRVSLASYGHFEVKGFLHLIQPLEDCRLRNVFLLLVSSLQPIKEIPVGRVRHDEHHKHLGLPAWCGGWDLESLLGFEPVPQIPTDLGVGILGLSQRTKILAFPEKNFGIPRQMYRLAYCV